MPPPRVTDEPSHLRGLDGVRGIAILLVVVGHVGLLPRRTIVGGVGVTVFSVLSGFLITTVLLRRRSLGHFYGARAARLLPALVAVVLGAGVVWFAQGRPAGSFAGYATTAMLYVENVAAGWHGESVFAHLWSLAVEEQFYLLWPLAVPFLVCTSVRTRAVLIAVAITVSLLLRFALLRIGWEAQALASLPVNAYVLLAGCALALLGVPRLRPGTALVCGTVIVGASLSVGMVVWRQPYVVPVVAAPGAVLLVIAGIGGARPLTWRPLRFLGDVSYSWYLWHWPLLWLLGLQFHPRPGVLVVLIALVIATASTRYDGLDRVHGSALGRDAEDLGGEGRCGGGHLCAPFVCSAHDIPNLDEAKRIIRADTLRSTNLMKDGRGDVGRTRPVPGQTLLTDRDRTTRQYALGPG